MKVAIVGAGVSGLSAAWRLKKLGIEPVIFEARDQVGGAISTTHADGFIAENGPHTLLNSQAIVDEIIDDLDLTEDRIWASELANKRFAVKDGRPVALPMSAADFLRSPLYSRRSKLRLLAEVFVAPRSDGIDESVTSFVKRRLGEDFLNYGVDLMVNGIWAGDPNRLSMRHAFKKMWSLEAASGSIIKGAFAVARDKSRRKNASAIFSFRYGNQQLVDALANGQDVRLSTPVYQIRPDGAGWLLRTDPSKEAQRFDAVVSSVDARSFSKILDDPDAQRLSDRLYYPPVAVVTLGFLRRDVEHALDGFGMLVPNVEGRDILGTMFTSTFFENRAPDDCVTIATFVGGARHGANALLPSSQRELLVRRELKALLGVRGEPVFRHEKVWTHAIPQYEVGHSDVQVWAQSIERKYPNLVISSNFRDAIAVPDLIAAGVRHADALFAGVS